MGEPLQILILSREAEDYRAALAAAPGLPRAVELILADHPGAIGKRALESPVALGEPDLLAAAAQRMPALRWVQSTWAGLTPLLPAAESGVIVTGVKDVFGDQMAEYALGHMLSHVLALPERRAARKQRQWLETPTGTLAGKTLGVMGTGSIGSAIARRAKAFAMTPLGFSRSGAHHDDFAGVYSTAELHRFLSGLDFLIAVLPDTPETAGLLDEPALRALPAHAQLINVGRGSLIPEADLLRVLGTGHLAEVVLDVFQTEPLPADHAFWSAPRLQLTAHVAARSWPRDIAKIFLENLERYMHGQALRYQLVPERGY